MFGARSCCPDDSRRLLLMRAPRSPSLHSICSLSLSLRLHRSNGCRCGCDDCFSAQLSCSLSLALSCPSLLLLLLSILSLFPSLPSDCLSLPVSLGPACLSCPRHPLPLDCHRCCLSAVTTRASRDAVAAAAATPSVGTATTRPTPPSRVSHSHTQRTIVSVSLHLSHPSRVLPCRRASASVDQVLSFSRCKST